MDEKFLNAFWSANPEKINSCLSLMSPDQIKKIIFDAPREHYAAQAALLQEVFNSETMETELPDWKIEIFLNFAFNDTYVFRELFYDPMDSAQVVPLFEKIVLAIKPEKLLEKLSSAIQEQYKEFSTETEEPIKKITDEAKEIDNLIKNENPDWQKIFKKLKNIESQSVGSNKPLSQRFLFPYFEILKQDVRKKIQEKSLPLFPHDKINLWEMGWSISNELKKNTQREEKEEQELILKKLDFILEIEEKQHLSTQEKPFVSEFLKKQKTDLGAFIENKKHQEINDPKLKEIIADCEIHRSENLLEQAILNNKDRDDFTRTQEMQNFLNAYDALPKEEKESLYSSIEKLTFANARLNHLKKTPNGSRAKKTMEEISTGLNDLKKRI